MATWWDNIQIKKGSGGVGDVTDEEKNHHIEQAVKTWERMGLTEDQIAFGIGVMGLESGFNPRAGNAGSSAKGLGQFTEGTWKDAVRHYNTRAAHRKLFEPDIDPVTGSGNIDSQIQVMGPWIANAWEQAAAIPRKKAPKGYGFDELAYGKWHEGMNKDAEGIGKYLGKHAYDNSDIRGYFVPNVDRARQALRMRKSNQGTWITR
jgi:hypothetical protein